MSLTVIVATYNSENYLPAAIASLRKAQMIRPLEVLVIDGGSKDGTMKVLSASGIKHRFMRQKKKGLYNALNEGVTAVNTTWLTFLHSDDIWLSPPSVPVESDSSTVWVGDVAFFKDPSDILYKRRMPWFPKSELKHYPFIFHPNAVYPAALLRQFPFDEKPGNRKADMVQIAAMASKTDFKRMAGFCYGFRIHAQSTTVGGVQHERESWRFWFWRIYVFLLYEDYRARRVMNFMRGRRAWKI